ncbi:hypothetical protein EVAR_58264_1 [Eumeta japonica]|uniref:Uncharacterized protein n=1 Tax=Eumeta variegata TaxID=151549 RepID=A0A4C1ZI69_EUMVA|nr:hypothetical protein EVAR_58264_1 [Eumeta japonica]
MQLKDGWGGGPRLGTEVQKTMASKGVVHEFPVQKEYLKNPDINPEDVKKLREWLDDQPHLPGKYITGHVATAAIAVVTASTRTVLTLK